MLHKKIKLVIAKFETGKLSEDEFIQEVVAMAKSKSSSERKIEGLLIPFWVHFIRENFEFDAMSTNLRDLKMFTNEIKKANRKKGEPDKFWFDEEQLQEISEDIIDGGILKLRLKYRDNADVNVEDVIFKLDSRERPEKFKEGKLWPQGFKFSQFDDEFYTQW